MFGNRSEYHISINKREKCFCLYIPITRFGFWPAPAQVYWDAIFLVSQEVYLNFHHFWWVKLWVWWVGRGYIEISRYFPALWINRVTLVTKIKLWYSLGYHITFESPKNAFMVCFFASRSLIEFVQYTIPPPPPPPPQQLLWLADYLS